MLVEITQAMPSFFIRPCAVFFNDPILSLYHGEGQAHTAFSGEDHPSAIQNAPSGAGLAPGFGAFRRRVRAVIDQGFTLFALPEVITVTSVDNARSRRVMDRLGMLYSSQDDFDHPLFPDGDPRRKHVVYRLRRF